MKSDGNGICFETGTAEPRWASVSHGIFLSIAAAGEHRGLGVHISFVQSTDMDKWKPISLRMMQLGGNERFRAFLQTQGVPEDMPLAEKYKTNAADWYRRNLQALAKGERPPAPLLEGTGHLPAPVELTVPDNGTMAFIADIDSLPSQTLNSLDGLRDQKNCEVCLDAFALGDYVQSLTCGHLFHGGCVEQWFQANAGCMLCGVPLRAKGKL